nr:2-dehydropantoate 2-reductase [Sphingomonas sp. Y57]
MRIVIVGAGAMGSLYAGMLARAGRDVWLLGRSPAHIAAIRSDGLTMRIPGRAEAWQAPVRATTDPSEPGVADIVVFLTKTYDLEEAARGAKPLFGPETIALPLSNGVGTADAVAAALGTVRTACGVSEVGGDIVAPGVMVMTENVALGTGYTRFGKVSADVPAETLRAFAAELEQSGLRAELVDDILGVVWTKVAMSGTMSSLSALTRLRMGRIADAPEGWELIETMIGEIDAVTSAAGISFDREATLRRARGVFLSVPNHVPSMAADLREGRRTENQALAGAVSREGARLGVPTPMCDAIHRMITLVEANPGASIW